MSDIENLMMEIIRPFITNIPYDDLPETNAEYWARIRVDQEHGPADRETFGPRCRVRSGLRRHSPEGGFCR